MVPTRQRHAWALAFLLVASLALVAAAADSRNRAGLIINFGAGRVETFCVSFSEPEITGHELLQRAGVELVTSAANMGAAMCQIADTGCPANNCFCECRGDPCLYWSYWHQLDGAWSYATSGASTYRVSDGSVDGWSWGPGSITEAPEPPLLSFEELCVSPATPEAEQAQPVSAQPDMAVSPGPPGGAASTVTQPVESNGTSALWAYGLAALAIVGLGGWLFWTSRRRGDEG